MFQNLLKVLVKLLFLAELTGTWRSSASRAWTGLCWSRTRSTTAPFQTLGWRKTSRTTVGLCPRTETGWTARRSICPPASPRRPPSPTATSRTDSKTSAAWRPAPGRPTPSSSTRVSVRTRVGWGRTDARALITACCFLSGELHRISVCYHDDTYTFSDDQSSCQVPDAHLPLVFM